MFEEPACNPVLHNSARILIARINIKEANYHEGKLAKICSQSILLENRFLPFLVITVPCVVNYRSKVFSTIVPGLVFQFSIYGVIVMACVLNHSPRVFSNSRSLSVCLRSQRFFFGAVFLTFLLQRNLPQMFALLMERYAMIQVSILLQPCRIVVAKFAPGNFGFPSLFAEPLVELVEP